MEFVPREKRMKDIITFEDLCRYYPSTNVQANDHVSFSVHEGEIHAICGENGAGKSTLMNILFGLERPDTGSIFVDGAKVSFNGPSDAIEAGIGMVHQHFMVVNSFTVAQNILLGNELVHRGFLSHKEETAFVNELSEKYHLPIDPNAVVETLPVGLLQRVEILKMLARKVRILILDEPTAVLTPQEVKPFLQTLRDLAANGQTILFISHKLQEVLDVSDRITVMRKGKVIGTKNTADTTIPELANMMVGRDVVLQVDKTPANPTDVVLDVRDLSYRNGSGIQMMHDVSFQLRAGEIYGIAGVSGNGQDALVSCLCGMHVPTSGTISLLGEDISHFTVKARRRAGVAHVPEDRIHVGLNMQASVQENTLMGFQEQIPFKQKGMLSSSAIATHAQDIIDAYSVAGASIDSPVRMLSGGNMQKIVLGRELASHPKLLIVNQPTRGLDVGSIEFVHQMIIRQRDEGVAVLLISVELEEILSLSDRVGVLFSGMLQGELEGEDINERNIGLLMVGGTCA